MSTTFCQPPSPGDKRGLMCLSKTTPSTASVLPSGPQSAKATLSWPRHHQQEKVGSLRQTHDPPYFPPLPATIDPRLMSLCSSRCMSSSISQASPCPMQLTHPRICAPPPRPNSPHPPMALFTSHAQHPWILSLLSELSLDLALKWELPGPSKTTSLFPAFLPL